MAGGQLVVIGAVVREGAEFAGMSLAEIGAAMGPEWDFLFGAITRGGVSIIPRGNETLEVGDHVRVVSKPSARRQVLDLLGVPGGRAKRVMILGGGSIGGRLAETLQDEGVSVVLIEGDRARAEALAEQLPRVAVVLGDVNDTELLAQEAIGRMDAVVAATGEDGANVLACAFAAAEGAVFTVAVLHRLALLPLVSRFGIDAALSPRTASANSVLRQVRGGTSAVATFLETDAEADEIEIEEGSLADGAVVADLHLPRSILLGAVTHPDGSVEIVRGRTTLKSGDHVVVFARPDSLASAHGFFTK
jgi:trk system potassium uptake protein TrkA